MAKTVDIITGASLALLLVSLQLSWPPLRQVAKYLRPPPGRNQRKQWLSRDRDHSWVSSMSQMLLYYENQGFSLIFLFGRQNLIHDMKETTTNESNRKRIEGRTRDLRSSYR